MIGFAIAIVLLFSLSLSSWYLSKDFVNCTVISAGSSNANGYYAAMGGIYYKRGYTIYFVPDVFKLFELRKNTQAGVEMSLSGHSWVILTASDDQWLYKATPNDIGDYLMSPPKIGWKVVDSGVAPSPVISTCHGSLTDSPPLPSATITTRQRLLGRPVTTLLLIAIFCYYYHLVYAAGTEPSDVAFSYEGIVLRGEVWRVVTATFAHFDPWHVLFNAFVLFQVGDFEISLGSVVFAYLTVGTSGCS